MSPGRPQAGTLAGPMQAMPNQGSLMAVQTALQAALNHVSQSMPGFQTPDGGGGGLPLGPQMFPQTGMMMPGPLGGPMKGQGAEWAGAARGQQVSDTQAGPGMTGPDFLFSASQEPWMGQAGQDQWATD